MFLLSFSRTPTFCIANYMEHRREIEIKNFKAKLLAWLEVERDGLLKNNCFCFLASITSFLQRTHESVTETMKRQERKQLIKQLFIEDEEESLSIILKKLIWLRLNDCRNVEFNESYDVKTSVKKKVFSIKKVMQEVEKKGGKITVAGIRNNIVETPGWVECHVKEVDEWL